MVDLSCCSNQITTTFSYILLDLIVKPQSFHCEHQLQLVKSMYAIIMCEGKRVSLISYWHQDSLILGPSLYYLGFSRSSTIALISQYWDWISVATALQLMWNFPFIGSISQRVLFPLLDIIEPFKISMWVVVVDWWW